MIEISLLWKYLIPRRGRSAASLIVLLSILVISAVVCLILLFLSVISGMEDRWVGKISTLQAPIRLTLSTKYYSTYNDLLDPVEFDRSLKREYAPIEKARSILNQLPKERSSFQEFEMSAALLRLQMLRACPEGIGSSFLTQASYLISFSEQISDLKSLLLAPSIEDSQQLLFLAEHRSKYSSADQKGILFRDYIRHFNDIASVGKMKTSSLPWRFPSSLLPEGIAMEVEGIIEEGGHFSIDLDRGTKGFLLRSGDQLFWNGSPFYSPIWLETPLTFKATLLPSSLDRAEQFSDLRLSIEGSIGRGMNFQGEISWEGVELVESDLKKVDLSKQFEEYRRGEAYPLFLGKQFREQGVKMGDRGSLIHPMATIGGFQEQKIAVFVLGFYDSGIMGQKSILAPLELVHMINESSAIQYLDKNSSAGFGVWLSDLKETARWAEEIKLQLKNSGIDSYWNVSTYYDYARDLIEQFESDRSLLILVGFLILFVACSNLISLLIILINDKKREIAILQACGASRKMISIIFGAVAGVVGLISYAIGVVAAFLTLIYMKPLLSLFKFLRGNSAFDPLFLEGISSYPINNQAIILLLIATPLLSLIVGLATSWYAARLTPAQLLRSD